MFVKELINKTNQNENLMDGKSTQKTIDQQSATNFENLLSTNQTRQSMFVRQTKESFGPKWICENSPKPFVFAKKMQKIPTVEMNLAQVQPHQKIEGGALKYSKMTLKTEEHNSNAGPLTQRNPNVVAVLREPNLRVFREMKQIY